MKSILVAIGIVIAIIAFAFIVRQPIREGVGKLNGIFSSTENAVAAAQEAVALWGTTTQEIKALKTQNEAVLAMLEQSNTNILLLEESVKNLSIAAAASKAEIDSLKSLLKPEPPGDFKECLEQLDVSHKVINAQDGKMQTLKAINTEQGIIISEKDVIISLKEEQLELCQGLVRHYKIRMRVATTLSIIGWIIMLL